MACLTHSRRERKRRSGKILRSSKGATTCNFGCGPKIYMIFSCVFGDLFWVQISVTATWSIFAVLQWAYAIRHLRR